MQKIFDDLFDLGWYVVAGYGEDTLMLKKEEEVDVGFFKTTAHCYININKVNKTVSASKLHSFSTQAYTLSLEELRLVHKLVEVINNG